MSSSTAKFKPIPKKIFIEKDAIPRSSSASKETMDVKIGNKSPKEFTTLSASSKKRTAPSTTMTTSKNMKTSNEVLDLSSPDYVPSAAQVSIPSAESVGLFATTPRRLATSPTQATQPTLPLPLPLPLPLQRPSTPAKKVTEIDLVDVNINCEAPIIAVPVTSPHVPKPTQASVSQTKVNKIGPSLKKNRMSQALSNMSLSDGVHQIMFEGGNQYEGDIRNGEFHGQGKFTWANGDIFEGTYQNGQREGFGRYKFGNGDIFEGNFHKNVKHGKGKYIAKNGDICDGEFKQGVVDGIAKVVYHSGNSYEGQFVDGKRNGVGVFKYAVGDMLSYEGSFENDLPHGHGKCTYKNGDIYEGEFSEDKLHGKGKYIWANGITYEGEFQNNAIHGKGKMIRSKNDIIEGTFNQGAIIV